MTHTALTASFLSGTTARAAAMGLGSLGCWVGWAGLGGAGLPAGCLSVSLLLGSFRPPFPLFWALESGEP